MSLFIKLDTSKEKSIDLLNAVERLSSGMTDDKIFCVNHEDFKSIPGSPFSYWVPQKIRDLFSVCEPFESDSRTAKVGLSTGDDSRFLRNWWEVKDQNKWITFPKGGVFSPFFAYFGESDQRFRSYPITC